MSAANNVFLDFSEKKTKQLFLIITYNITIIYNIICHRKENTFFFSEKTNKQTKCTIIQKCECSKKKKKKKNPFWKNKNICLFVLLLQIFKTISVIFFCQFLNFNCLLIYFLNLTIFAVEKMELGKNLSSAVETSRACSSLSLLF